MRIRDNKGFTLIELLIVVAIIGIIAAIAVPGLMRARQSGNETSAIGSLSAINKGQASFAATCGNNMYVASLENLVKGPSNGPGYISPDLDTNGKIKSGYAITLGAGNATAGTGTILACNGVAATATYTGYIATAESKGGGSRDFATNGAGTIYYAAKITDITAAYDKITGGNPLQ